MSKRDPRIGARTSSPDNRPEEALTLVLVRHGPTTMTVAGKLSGGGVPGPPLTEYGRIMAERAAGAVERVPELWPDTLPVTGILSSPLTRAVETAGIIGDHLGLPVHIRNDLRETEFGTWDGLTPREIDALEPGGFAKWHHEGTHAPPGGESYEHTGQRITAEIDRITGEGYARTLAVVGHTAMIRATLGHVLGMPPNRIGRFVIAACSLTIVQFWPQAAEVLTVAYPTT
ncbi:MAG: histidine phosphatase family protein [Promicromonosporaceae bacterium]|nr:histidine phosphatase family protein [Promicromonosporaceae bacterium]